MASDKTHNSQQQTKRIEEVGLEPETSIAQLVSNSTNVNDVVDDEASTTSKQRDVKRVSLQLPASSVQQTAEDKGSQTVLSNGFTVMTDETQTSVFDTQIFAKEGLESKDLMLEILDCDDKLKIQEDSSGLTSISNVSLQGGSSSSAPHKPEDGAIESLQVKRSSTTPKPDYGASNPIVNGPIDVLSAVKLPETSYDIERVRSTSSLMSNSSHSVRWEGGEAVAVLEGDAKTNIKDPLSGDPVPMEVAVAYSADKRFLKYDIEIGRGSFKTVYKGLDTETGVAIAWCELQEKRYNKVEQARFKEEVSILTTLQHPNILKLYASWEAPGHRPDKKGKVLILVTELMTSGTLKNYMRRLKSIKPKVIRSWGRQILRGLHFLHTRVPPIIHRDLKCDNIFINGTTGLVKIGDLGLATLKRSEVSTVIGTPEFMAPEMYEESYDESVDIYAFGMCLLEICTQEYPYMECSNPAQIYKRVSSGIKPLAIDKVKDPTLRDIIKKCTTVNKTQRYTVQDLLNHEFFVDNIKMEQIPAPEPSEKQSATPTQLLTVRMDVPKQDTTKKNGQQSIIEFTYHMEEDVAEDVVSEMVKSGILLSSVQHMVSRSLREYVEGVKQKRHPARSIDEGKPHELMPFASTNSLAYDPYFGDHETIPEEPEVPVKAEDGLVTNNEEHSRPPSQGQDMTGQGAITMAAVERERSLTLNAKEVHEPKLSDLVHLTPANIQLGMPDHHHQSDSSIHQQITSSTGQAVPQIPASKKPELKAQSTVTVSENKSYASTTRKGIEQTASDSIAKVNTSIPLQTTPTPAAEKPCTDRDIPKPSIRSNPVISSHDDASAESTPVRQAHSDTEAISVMSEREENVLSETLKKKSLRSKPKTIKVTFIELIKETKVIQCELLTNNGTILKYRFSLKYDKPEEMFLKFVTAGHLTEQDKDEFLHQSGQVIQKVKGTSSTKESKTEHSDPKLPSLGISDTGKNSTGTIASPPTETTAMPDLQRPPAKDTSEKTVHPTEGKLDMTKPTVVSRGSGLPEPHRSELVAKTPLPSAPDPGPSKDSVSVPSSSSLGAVGSSQPYADKASVHSQAVHSQLHHVLSAGSLKGNLSSCSLPQILSQPSNASTQPGTGNTVSPPVLSSGSVIPVTAPVTQRVKIFEVEAVPEDHPDSPETLSDLSAEGSTDNLAGEEKPSLPSNSNDSKRFPIHSISSGGLESKSDSHIAKESTKMRQFTGPISQDNHVMQSTVDHSIPGDNQPLSSQQQQHSYVLPQPVDRQWYTNDPRISTHYCTTSAMDSSIYSQRMGLTEQTFLPYSRNHSYSVISNLAPPEVDDPAVDSRSLPAQCSPTIDDLPNASLLSEAFMRFLHSMSIVFRDPTFHPLIDSLDQKFNPLHQQAPPANFTYPPTEPVPPPVYPAEQHHEPGVMDSNSIPRELQTYLRKIEEKQRKLEKMKQQMITNYQNRKHSTSSNSFESSTGLLDSHQVAHKPSPIHPPSHTKRSLKQVHQSESTDHPVAQGLLQKGGNKVLTGKLTDMEKQIKDQLTGDMLSCGTSSADHKQQESWKPPFRPCQHDDVQTVTKSPPPSTKHLPTTSAQSDPSTSPHSVGVQTFQIQTSPSSSINYTGHATPKSYSSHSESQSSTSIQPWCSNPEYSRYSHPDHRNQWAESTSVPGNTGPGRGSSAHETPFSDLSTGRRSKGSFSSGTGSVGRNMSELDPITLGTTAS